jgi:hypothetical protein
MHVYISVKLNQQCTMLCLYGIMQDTMNLLQLIQKGSRMNTLEQYYIQKYQCNKKLIPEQNTGEYNPLFKIAFDLQWWHADTWQNRHPRTLVSTWSTQVSYLTRSTSHHTTTDPSDTWLSLQCTHNLEQNSTYNYLIPLFQWKLCSVIVTSIINK